MIRISYKESTAGARQSPAYHTGHYTLEFSGDVLTLGRSRTCDLVLADRRVSGVHCELRVVSGELFVSDLGSTNGTFANREGVGVRRITSQDILQIGDTTFIASYEAATETSGLHPPGTMRSRIEPPSTRRRGAAALAAPRVAPGAEATAPFTLPPARPSSPPKRVNPSLLLAGGLLGLGYLLFGNGPAALLLAGSVVALDAAHKHLDNQSLILKELQRLRRKQFPAEREPSNA